MSLDAFRGFTIIAMLVVNNLPDAGRFHQLNHANWGEFVTFCDMIFPWFLLIVGVALPFARSARLSRGVPLRQFLAHAMKRAATLYFLGVLIDSSVSKRLVVGLGVLQLIALAYLCAACACELRRGARVGLIALLLVGYWALIRFLPVPGIGMGSFTEDANPVAYLNRVFLSRVGLKGFLSVAPATALVLIGSLVGDLLRDKAKPVSWKLAGLLVRGCALALAGLAWHLSIPMSKHVWSPSYVLFAGGLGILVLALFYWAIDLSGFRRWAFVFVIYGVNPIAAYFISIMVRIHTVQEWTVATPSGDKVSMWNFIISWFAAALTPGAGAWVFIAAYIGFWWLVLWWMSRRGIIWKV
jgi:predicted acyltransferase